MQESASIAFKRAFAYPCIRIDGFSRFATCWLRTTKGLIIVRLVVYLSMIKRKRLREQMRIIITPAIRWDLYKIESESLRRIKSLPPGPPRNPPSNPNDHPVA